MFERFRQWRLSPEEKRQEAISAYLDETLSPAERARFEQDLAQDRSLQAEVDSTRQLKNLLSQAPRLRAPRNFVLNPAEYAKPAPSYAERIYPTLRNTTVASAAVFALFLAFVVVGPSSFSTPDTASAPVAVQQEAASDTIAEAEIIQPTLMAEPELEPAAEAEMESVEEEAEFALEAEAPAETEMADEAPNAAPADESMEDQEIELAETEMDAPESLELEEEADLAEAPPAAAAEPIESTEGTSIENGESDIGLMTSDEMDNGGGDAGIEAQPVSPRATPTEAVSRTVPETATPIPTQTPAPTPEPELIIEATEVAIDVDLAEAEPESVSLPPASSGPDFGTIAAIVLGLLTATLFIATLIVRARR